MRKASIFLILGVLALSSCGGSSGGGSDTSNVAAQVQSVETQAIKTTKQFFGENGNLWKPAAEEKSSTAGLLVVLLGPEHTGRFDSCEIERTNGEFEQLDCNDRVPWSHEPYSCVANGGREHWRATFRCDQSAQVRIVCSNFSEEVTFEARGPAILAVCDRHG